MADTGRTGLRALREPARPGCKAEMQGMAPKHPGGGAISNASNIGAARTDGKQAESVTFWHIRSIVSRHVSCRQISAGPRVRRLNMLSVWTPRPLWSPLSVCSRLCCAHTSPIVR